MSTHTENKILVVEDDPSWQNLLNELIVDLGFTADIASDLDQAELFLHNTTHNLAIVDLSLDIKNHKNSDGFVILQKIRQLDPGCTSILLSGHATVEYAVKAIKEYGAYTCLHKEDFSRRSFKQTVQEALAQQAPQLSAPSGTEIIDLDQPNGEKNILIVDDDAGWRHLLSEIFLSRSGYSVQVSGSFGEAIGFLARNIYDLAIIDLSLDRNTQSPSSKTHDGFRLLKNCNVKGISTIVVSGVGLPEEIEKIYQDYQIFSYIEKQTFERDLFFKTINLALDQKSFSGILKELTERELQVLSLLAKGLTNKEIANNLIVSPNTIKRHIKSIFAKLNVRTRSAATAKAINAGVSIA